MKTILKNLLSVLRRFQMATILNVLGLSIAFAAFMVIMIQLDYDRNFDRSHPDADCIYRVEVVFDAQAQAIINRPLSDLIIQSSPHIVAGALVNPWSGDLFFQIEKDGVKHNFQEKSLQVYSAFADVFSMDFTEGTKDVLGEPGKVVIPQTMARKFFGESPAVGQILQARNNMNFTVGGVYKDFPANSAIENAIYYMFPDDLNKNVWGNWNYFLYLKVDQAENADGLIENFKRVTDPKLLGENFKWGDSQADLRLTSLPEMHYTTGVRYDPTPKASRQTLLVLLAIAIMIVVIAGINFTNFSTALTPMRIKSINTQKVLGEDESVIRRSLIMEAILISLFSYLLAVGLVALLKLTSFTSLIDADISLSAHPLIVAGTALIAFLTGLLAGIYPAFNMTSYPPALVLKGSFGLSPKGRRMRGVLISVQYISSFALIIGSLFMYLQNYYMQNSPLGYAKDQIIVTNLNGKINESREAFTNQVQTFAGIEGVTYSEPLLSSGDQYMGWGRPFKDQQIDYQCLPVNYTFLDVMDVEITEGRRFRREDANTRNGAYVFNEKARAQYGMEIGDMIDSTVIVGFMPDVKFASFRTEVVPMAFFVWGTQNWGNSPNYAYVKVSAGSDMRAALNHIKTSLQMFDSEYPFNVRFFDAVLQRLYEKERSLSSLITLFSIIAIFISIVGVFGLVVFDSEYRRKEIGIRKVMGSTTGQILLMFNKTYLILLVICFLIAVPIASIAVYQWLQNFAYKTPMYLWVYAVAFIIVGLITVCTVTFQNWRAADDNPVNSIKSE